MTLDGIARLLGEAGIRDARREAMLLIGRFAGISPARILADRTEGTEYDSPLLADAVEKRSRRIPLQYILGEWEFMGLPLRVTEDCLIPRPDTEIIAERAAALLPENGRFLDLCTGSGCIACALCSLTEDRGTSGLAVELVPETAALARENLASLGFAGRCAVLTGDLGDPDPLLPPGERYDVIVSNPPYVTAEEMESLEPELSFEPRIALTDEGDGLSLIRRILALYGSRLKPGGALVIEHGWRQGEAVRALAGQYGYAYAPIRDYGGNLRGAELRPE